MVGNFSMPLNNVKAAKYPFHSCDFEYAKACLLKLTFLWHVSNANANFVAISTVKIKLQKIFIVGELNFETIIRFNAFINLFYMLIRIVRNLAFGALKTYNRLWMKNNLMIWKSKSGIGVIYNLKKLVKEYSKKIKIKLLISKHILL
jgi:hypothetical protein